MDLREKIRTLPTQPGVYLYKNAEGEVIYVGKAINLRARVRSYLLASSQANAKTGSLMREAVDVDYIVVASESEALALETNLIKERLPRFNILLKDDKSYPYVKLTLGDRFPKVFVTRRLRKDGSAYFGPYFPSSLAYRVVELIQRSFQIPNCKIDLSRYHPRACLQHYIHRCLGPCMEGLTTIDIYKGAIRDAQLLLEGRHAELERTLTTRMTEAAGSELYESAAKLRDQITVVHQLQEKQRAATAALSDDSDVFGYHFEDGSLAVNLFHVRAGKIVDRREFFWDELPEILEAPDTAVDEEEEASLQQTRSRAPSLRRSSGARVGEPPSSPVGVPGLLSETGESRSSEAPFPAGLLFSALLKQIYIGQVDLPRSILVPVDFADRLPLAALLGERAGHRIELAVPLRGEKRSLVDLAAQNAKQSYIQRFRVLIPSQKAIQEALADALLLPELPRRIECFDISHIQGAETVASLVVWEDGKMNKQAYRKFKIKTVEGVDDFASMFEVVQRRYRRLQDENQPLPSLVLVDGGLGQLHAAADALESVGLPTQPLASIAKKEEIIYVHGSEDDPIVLDRRSPVLHLVQLIRDESHRFAIGYHRQRRSMRDRDSELLTVPGVGAQTRKRLLTHFGSLREVQQATADSLAAVVPRPTAEAIWAHFHPTAQEN
jgi:excinuclease ABC subunit C